MSGLTPKQWFDQFPPLVEGAPWNTDGQWCPRHWAPCPTLGANGIGAATELMQVFINEIAPKSAHNAKGMNAAMKNAGYLCCTLGDERMYEIWGHWPPTEPVAEEVEA